MQAASFLGLSLASFELSQSLSDDIAFVDHLLGAVVSEQEDAELLVIARALYAESDQADPRELIGRIPQLDDVRFVQRLLRAYTVLFQLINTAEQKEIVRVNRERQARAGGSPRSESIAEAIQSLSRAGTSADEMQRLIDRLDVCPTLTAHPTEARRRSVLDKLQSIAGGLVERGIPPDTPQLDRALNTEETTEREMLRVLTALWQTDELRAAPISVRDEATNTLYFFERSIFAVVSWLHDDLRAALGEAYPGHAFRIGPFVRYGSWVGGDRDGNSNVTPDVTWETLLRHKTSILENYIERVEAVRRELSLSARLVEATPELMRSLETDGAMITLSAEQMRRYQLEPYALKLVYVQAEFWTFYAQATPIKYISRLPIASRPASRSRQLSGLDALRAIPWVFAWVQSRYVVPGWYGLGSALRAVAENKPDKIALLTQMYREWLFFRMVINNAQLELLRAHLPTAEWYAKRVRPRELGARMHERLAQEHRLSCEWILRITEQKDLLEHAPVVRRTVDLRNPAMRPLSKLQVAVLDLLDREEEQGRKSDPGWQEAMLLSIIGIAAAMQSTG